MPSKKCKGSETGYYKGSEPSPKGLGYCARDFKLGTVKKGKDGKKWIVKKNKTTGVRRWVKYSSSKKVSMKRTKKSATKKATGKKVGGRKPGARVASILASQSFWNKMKKYFDSYKKDRKDGAKSAGAKYIEKMDLKDRKEFLQKYNAIRKFVKNKLLRSTNRDQYCYGISEDRMDDFSKWIILNGKKYVNLLLKDPVSDTLVKASCKKSFPEYTPIDYYNVKTGKYSNN